MTDKTEETYDEQEKLKSMKLLRERNEALAAFQVVSEARDEEILKTAAFKVLADSLSEQMDEMERELIGAKAELKVWIDLWGKGPDEMLAMYRVVDATTLENRERANQIGEQLKITAMVFALQKEVGDQSRRLDKLEGRDDNFHEPPEPVPPPEPPGFTVLNTPG